MPGGERIFVTAIRQYCARHDIEVDVREDGWLIAMRRGARRHFTLGYDIGVNSSIAHRLANDKSATADILALSGVPCIFHHIFLNPKMGEHIAASGSWDAMQSLLEQNPQGVVVKPNEGTAGRSVFKVTKRRELELAVGEIFSSYLTLAIAPFVDIEEEVRVILLDQTPMVVYRKERPSVVGDGRHTLRELSLGFVPGRLNNLDRSEPEAIVPEGERRALNWRHNLDTGAQPFLMEQGEGSTACVKIAAAAVRAIGIDFAAVDVVRSDGAWKVLEINSGVRMEALGARYLDLVCATYAAALDRIFNQPSH